MPYGKGYGLPGDRLTGGQGARLAALLARQNLNNGTPAGGLAHALQQGLMGLMMKRDIDAANEVKQQQEASTRNLAAALEQGQGIPAETKSYGDGTTINWNERKADPNAMMRTLASDPINSRLAANLMMAQASEQMKPETFGAPVGVIGPDGKPVLLRPGNRGTNAEVPGGYQPSPKSMSEAMPSNVQEWQYFSQLTPEQQNQYLTMKRTNPYINLGGSMALPAPAQPGRFQAEVPKTLEPGEQPDIKGAQARATAAGKTEGEATTTAALDLPKVEGEAEYMLGLLEKAKTHPGMSGVVGMPNFQGALRVPGTPEADFRTLLGQIGGKQFLQAFQSLKGGGQITEVEGRKATEAIARMDTAQTEKEFRAAVEEFDSVVRAGLERARKAGGKAPPAGAAPGGAPAIKFLGFE